MHVVPAALPLLLLLLCRVSRQRYRALFALRNKGGEAAVAVLGEAFGASSALLKHEVAYVMGQMQHPASADVLCRVLQVRLGWAAKRGGGSPLVGTLSRECRQ